MPDVHENGKVRILGLALAGLNVVLWFSVPAIRRVVDVLLERNTPPGNPNILTGVQELYVYFDPWLVRGVFPFVYIVGLAILPFLVRRDRDDAGRNDDTSIVLVLLLLFSESVWLFLIVVAVVFRGPDWNFYWPWEDMVPKLVPINRPNFSDQFWVWLLGRSFEDVGKMPWYQRESAGLVLLAAYLLSSFGFAALLRRWTHRTTPYWRWLIFVVIVEVAVLIPIKMVVRWGLNTKYLIFVPEWGVHV